jgi:2-polyprenyl-6-methoxyphenol hydroxylase-like FAD-dependent oxidoreductase
MVIQDKKIAIIGGGPGGLTLARLLQMAGADVKVYERDLHNKVRLQGGALDLHEESGLAALAKAGLMEEFKANFRPGADKTRIVDAEGTLFFDEHAEAEGPDFGDAHFRPEIDRGPLRDILLASLKPDTVIWGSHISSLESVGESWNIVFNNGDRVSADFVIGADGANSKIRPYVTPIKPEWVGLTMVEGSLYDAAETAPNIHRLLQGGKIFAFGNSQSLIVSAKGDGNLGFATGCATTEFWWRDSGIDFNDVKQVAAWFKAEFSEWGDIWQELFNSDQSLFIPRPQYCMPLNQRWEAKTNITIIGDAAHWMPPYAGEGVNMAMLDALQLSESLIDPTIKDLKTAIGQYESSMFQRFEEIGAATMSNTQWMHEPGALDQMLAMFSQHG